MTTFVNVLGLTVTVWLGAVVLPLLYEAGTSTYVPGFKTTLKAPEESEVKLVTGVPLGVSTDTVA